MSFRHKHLYAFIDTNIFIEFMSVKDLDWNKLLDAEEVILLIAPPVVSELEKHKIHAKGRVQKRARAVLPTLPEDNEVHQLKKGLNWQCVYKRYNDYDQYSLDKSRPDDQLVLSAIHFCKETTDAEVRLVADDGGVRRTAKQNGISALRPPEEWRLDPEEDELVKDYHRLKKQEAASPKLSIIFSNGKRYQEFLLNRPPENDSSSAYQIGRKLEEKYQSRFIDKSKVFLSSVHLPGIASPYEVDEYNAELREFISDYQKQIPEWLAYKQWEARTIKLQLAIENQGKKPATNIALKLNFPEVLTLSFDKPEEPLLPKPPDLISKKIKSVLDLVEATQFSPTKYLVGPQRSAQIEPQLKKKLNKNTIEFELSRLQQEGSFTLSIVYITFTDWAEATGFDVLTSYICDQLAESESSTLNVPIKHDGLESSAAWDLPYLGDATVT